MSITAKTVQWIENINIYTCVTAKTVPVAIYYTCVAWELQMSERCERRQALFLRVKPKILSFVICAGNKGVFFLVPFLMYKSTSMLCLWNKGVFSSFVSFFDVIDFSYFFSKCTSVATLFNLIRHYRLAEGSPSQFERQDNVDWIFRWCQFQNHY